MESKCEYKMLKFKVILAGSKHVGKSAIIARFCDNTFMEKSSETIGVAFKRKLMSVNCFNSKIDADLVIWDFGGEEKYRVLFPNYVNKASGALILFDLTRPETLLDVDNWLRIIDANVEGVKKIIIGSKCDLIQERKVTRDMVFSFFKENSIEAEYIETSSKTGENVENAFTSLTKSIVLKGFQECHNCNELITKNLKICGFCGQKTA